MKRIKVIINPISGIKNKAKIPQLLQSELDATRYTYEMIYTDYHGHAREIALDSLNDETDIIVIVGGDGSINEVAEPLINSSIVLGIIPGGSGNGIARHFDIRLNFKKAIQLINTGKTKTIDTGVINGHFFVGFCGIGYDAHIAHRFNKIGNRGFWNYVKLVLSELKAFKSVTIQEQSMKTAVEHVFVCAFMNSSQFGNNFRISKNARADDGKLDMIIAQKPNIWGVLRIFYLGFFGDIHASKYVQKISAAQFKLNNPTQIAHVDGDPIHLTGNTIEVKCNPQSLTIIVGH